MSTLVKLLHLVWPACTSGGVKIGFGENPSYSARPSMVQMSPLGISIISDDRSFCLIRRWRRDSVEILPCEEESVSYGVLKTKFKTFQKDQMYIDEVGDRWKRSVLYGSYRQYLFLHWEVVDGAQAYEFTLYSDGEVKDEYGRRRKQIVQKLESAVGWLTFSIFTCFIVIAVWGWIARRM